mgnify:CR=1 FL=1
MLNYDLIVIGFGKAYNVVPDQAYVKISIMETQNFHLKAILIAQLKW